MVRAVLPGRAMTSPMWRVAMAGMTGAFALAIACGDSIRTPAYVRQPTAALVEVPYPPPPARAEEVPKPPKDDANAVWVDGEWVWQTRRWAWKPGRWVTMPGGVRFSPWTTVRDPTGTLYVASGVWRNDKGEEVDEPAVLEIGKSAAASIVTPEGDPVAAGPNAPLDGGKTRTADASLGIEGFDGSIRIRPDGSTIDDVVPRGAPGSEMLK